MARTKVTMNSLPKAVIVMLTFLSLSMAMVNSSLKAEDFNVSDLASAALSWDCLDWKIDGVCVFLRCGLFGCYIVTTPRISHRLPDLVVQSYANTAEAPWQEWQPLAKAAAQAASSALQGIFGTQPSGGAGSGTGPHRYTDLLQFFETDVVGNPIAKILKFGKFLCRSDVSPMKPYFVSATDALAWRSGLGELKRKESVTPGLREIGTGVESTWGSVYPRSGFVIQSDPARAAAVTAVRGTDIVTRDRSGHMAQSYKSSASARNVRRGDSGAKDPVTCRDSGGKWTVNKAGATCERRTWRQWRVDSSETDDNWQILTPESSKQCKAFGGTESPSEVAPDGEYAWHYWVRYRCCMKSGSFLGVF